MTPEDEEAHLAALLAGDDSSVDSSGDKDKIAKGKDNAEPSTEEAADKAGTEDKEAGVDDGREEKQDVVKAQEGEDKAMQAEDGDSAKVADAAEPSVADDADPAPTKQAHDASAVKFEEKIDAPSTPAIPQTPPSATLSLPIATPERPPRRSAERPRTPDPEVESLREQLAAAQRTISTQTARLGDLEEMHQRLSEQHKFLSAAKEAVETRLRDEVSKREAAEEAAEALRGQVEVARRGVMTLQKQEKERKRASMMGLPAGGIPGVGLGLDDVGEETEVLEEATIKAAKRSSTLLRNRRSSQTEAEVPQVSPNTTPGVTGTPGPTVSPPPANPPRSGLRELRLGASTSQLSPKLGGAALASSPSSQTAHMDDPYAALPRDRAVSGTPSIDPSISAELDSVRAELLAAQVRLSESEEARQASEDCLKALREFITGSGVEGEEAPSPGIVDLNDPAALMALKGIRLPPLPTDKDPDEPAPSVPEKKGWGFKIPTWKAAPGQTPLSPSSQAVEPATPRTGMSPPPSVRSSSYTSHEEAAPVAATPLSSFVSSWTRGVQPATPAADAPAPSDPQPTPRGFGGFFRRSNTNTSTAKDLPAPPTKINGDEDGDEVGSVGAEKGDNMDQNRLPSMSRQGSNPRPDLESRLRSQLQPSPEIKVGKLDEDEQFKPSTLADGDLSIGTIDSDAVLNTPNMSGELIQDKKADA